MLAKKDRLSRKLFVSLLDSRKVYHSPYFTLRVAESSERRLGVSVSKKVARKASDRNLLRRRIYGVVKSLFPTLPANLYLLSVKPGAGVLKGDKLSKEVAQILEKSYNH